MKRLYVKDNRKVMMRKNYADVVKVIHTQPIISEDKSSQINDQNSKNQVHLEKITFLLLKNEQSIFSRVATSLLILINDTSISINSFDSFRISGDFETFGTQKMESC